MGNRRNGAGQKFEGPHRMKPSTDATPMAVSAVLKVLETYFEAFAEKDADRRGELLAGCLTPDSAIWGHSQVFAGYAAISEKIAGFHVNFPDCRLVLASGLFAFENIVRFGVAIVGQDGFVVARGETVIELARDGRICRVVPLWDMQLPPLPDAWPVHLADSTVKADGAA
jgi:hypothetical protein